MTTPLHIAMGERDDAWLRAQIAAAVGPPDLTSMSDSEVAGLLDACHPETCDEAQVDQMLARFWTVLAQDPPVESLAAESREIERTPPAADRATVHPTPESDAAPSPVIGFLGDVMHFGGSFTPTLWTVLALVSGLVFSLVLVTVLAVRGIHVHVDDREVARGGEQGQGTRQQADVGTRTLSPSSSASQEFPDSELPSFPASPVDVEPNATGPMLDPATDKANAPWCYLAKSTTVIGVPFQPDVTQITFDGAVFTRNAELCFFYGPQNRPLLARGKTFLEGWMPVIEYAWREGDIAYNIEYFAAALDGEGAENTVNFVQLRMQNEGRQPQTGRFGAALRHNGGDNRMGGNAFSPLWKHEMTDSTTFRDGKLAYSFSPGAQREAVLGIGYQAPFLGIQFGLNARSECCLARYEHELQPGESFAACFKMPRVPTAESRFLSKLATADYAAYRNSTVGWWQKLIQSGARFSFPERCVQDAMRASLVHVMLATRTRNGRRMQTDGLPYPDFYLTAAAEEGLIYLALGHPELAKEVIVPAAIRRQLSDGLYDDVSVEHGGTTPAGHGQVLFISAISALYTQDKTMAAEIFPSVAKAVAYIEHSMQTDPYGLLPPAYPYDNEMIDGHYASNNFWGLLGLRSAVRLARFIGRDAEARAWTKLEQQYDANILKGIAASAKPDGYVPPGLYPYLTGKRARRGFNEYQTHCDWENMLLAYPGEVLAPQDPRVKGTVDHVRSGYAEGVMTYRHGMHLHQYITANQIEQYMVMGDSYTALKDFYHVLLHAGSTYECFENMVRPWTDRHVDPGLPPPHAWASAKLGMLIRDLVLLEFGGQCGLEPGRRELWLFHCLSPEWTRPGDVISFSDAPTEFGPISATMTSSKSGATIAIAARFHTPPACFRVRVPYFKDMRSYQTDAKTHRIEGDCVVLSPDATRIEFQWGDKPRVHMSTFSDLLREYRKADSFDGVDRDGRAVIGTHEPFVLDSEWRLDPQPLSFKLVREAFQEEYGRRAAGAAKLVRVEAPPLTPPRLSGAMEMPLPFTGAKATATGVERGFGPEKAIDGVLQIESSWRASPYPQTLNIELQKSTKLRGLRVWPYWGNGRYYQYCVDISADGKEWQTVGDRSKNTSPATEAGEQFLFAATEVRFIRVRMLYHSLNPGVHIVEVMGIEAREQLNGAKTASGMKDER